MRPRTRRRRGKPANAPRDTASGGRSRGGRGGARDPFWHSTQDAVVKDGLVDKGILFTTGTVDVSSGENRIKLGTGGYASMASAKGILAEGRFECDVDGKANFTFDKVIEFVEGEWKLASVEESDLPSTIMLTDGKSFPKWI